MKRILSIFLALTLCFLLVACGAESENLLVDEADILTASEEKAIDKKIQKIAENKDFDIVLMIVSNISGDILEYAEECYIDGGYREDGIILVVSIAQTPRYGYLVFGEGDAIFDDAAMDDLDAAFVDTFRDGDFNDAFHAFVDEVSAKTESLSGNSISVTMIVASILIGALLAWLIPMSMLKGELKSVRKQAAAESYVRKDSMVLTQERDLFLYRNITRVAKPKNNSSGGSGRTRTTSGGHRGRSG